MKKLERRSRIRTAERARRISRRRLLRIGGNARGADLVLDDIERYLT